MLNKKVWKMMLVLSDVSLADPMGGTNDLNLHLELQILSFSCSFLAKILQNNRLTHPLWELALPSGKSCYSDAITRYNYHYAEL